MTGSCSGGLPLLDEERLQWWQHIQPGTTRLCRVEDGESMGRGCGGDAGWSGVCRV